MNPPSFPLDLLTQGATELGLILSPHQLDQLDRYLAELLKWNRRMNLTGTTDPGEIVTHHLLDSLAGMLVLQDVADPAHIADLGSGAGFPGLPLKIARPSLHVTFIEPRQKRAAFLLHVSGVLGLTGIEVVEASIVPHRPPSEYAERFDRVLLRAVADPDQSVTLARPLLRRSGKVIVWVSERQAALTRNSGSSVVYRLPGAKIARALWVLSASE